MIIITIIIIVTIIALYTLSIYLEPVLLWGKMGIKKGLIKLFKKIVIIFYIIKIHLHSPPQWGTAD